MIPVKIFQIEIQSEKPMDFGSNPGSSIRGALYQTLSTIYDDGSETHSVDDTKNPVAWLFRLDPRETGVDTVPRPFGIRPPLVNNVSEASFSIALYGKGCDYTALMLSGVDSMQSFGIGKDRRKFKIKGITQIDPITQQSRTILVDGEVVGKIGEAPSALAYERFAQLLNPDRLFVEFLTPTRIRIEKKLRDEPIFSQWVGRLLSRIRKLSEFYTPNPVNIPFAELKPQLEQVKLLEDRTKWKDTISGSKRDRSVRPTGGFVGEAVYSGDLQVFLPYLILGQSLQVGSNVVKGSGWYRIHYEWL